MTKTRSKQPRPYRLTRTEAVDNFSGYSSREVHLGAFASLASAVHAARRWEAVCPNETYEIKAWGRIVRCMYHHGDASEWTADGDED